MGGSLTAKDAVTEAAKILLDQLNLFTNFDEHYVEPIEVVDEEKIQRDKYLSKPVAELELSVRSANCLEAKNQGKKKKRNEKKNKKEKKAKKKTRKKKKQK